MDKPGAFASMYRDQEQPQSGPSWGDVYDAAPGVAYSMLPPVAARDAYNAVRDGDPLGMGLAAAGAFLPAAKLGKKALDAGLDMSHAARMARAKEMGFDTDQVFYRGLGRPYDPNDFGYYQMFTSDRADASNYAMERAHSQKANVMPAYLRDGNPLEVDGRGANFNRVWTQGLPESIRGRLDSVASIDELAHAARDNGYSSLSVKNVFDSPGSEWVERSGSPVTVKAMFAPQDIRSVNAAFDPAKKNSANLLDSTIPGAVVGGSAYGAFAPANEEQY